MHKTFLMGLLFSNQLLLAFPYGKWYPNNWYDFLIQNQENEIIVSKGLFSGRNILCDENKVYVNNFFPYINCNYRQLADILKDKFQDINDEDLKNLKQRMPSEKESGILSKPYVESFLKYLNACKVYILTFSGDVSYLDEIILDDLISDVMHNECYGERLLNIIRKLQNPAKMKPIWDKMHTENLFLFDNYFNGNLDNPKIDVPTNRICFVSYLDMCQNCETMMINLLNRMEECQSTFFNNDGQYAYKILVGSFCLYGNSRSRDNASKLLKIKREIR